MSGVEPTRRCFLATAASLVSFPVRKWTDTAWTQGVTLPPAKRAEGEHADTEERITSLVTTKDEHGRDVPMIYAASHAGPQPPLYILIRPSPELSREFNLKQFLPVILGNGSKLLDQVRNSPSLTSIGLSIGTRLFQKIEHLINPASEAVTDHASAVPLAFPEYKQHLKGGD